MNKRKRLIKKNHFAVLTNGFTACKLPPYLHRSIYVIIRLVQDSRIRYSYTLSIITHIRGKYNVFCKSFYWYYGIIPQTVFITYYISGILDKLSPYLGNKPFYSFQLSPSGSACCIRSYRFPSESRIWYCTLSVSISCCRRSAPCSPYVIIVASLINCCSFSIEYLVFKKFTRSE